MCIRDRSTQSTWEKEFREVMLKLIEIKKSLGKQFSDSLMSLADANYAAGEFSRNVLDSVKYRSNIKLSMFPQNVAGVSLPYFKMRELDEDSGSSESVPLGLLQGGRAISKCKDRFKSLLELMVQIASLQTAFLTLDEVIKVTSRRVNALEHVVIPQIEFYIDFIKKVLDQHEREDFFRLKKLGDKKKKKKKKYSALIPNKKKNQKITRKTLVYTTGDAESDKKKKNRQYNMQNNIEKKKTQNDN
eukprot:TRINITY_DN57562_c0_g1_i5.p1 TRINITY_DN57562_c0_g1~~TRINITY_DN57562_c0_g1_i5.p1  ORF type:complete len:245 (+),score=63.48 TRINITY_DN57562_c0_g1_i5:75-809(+)